MFQLFDSINQKKISFELLSEAIKKNVMQKTGKNFPDFLLFLLLNYIFNIQITNYYK